MGGIADFDARTADTKSDLTDCNADFPVWTLRSLWTGARAQRAKDVVLADREGYVLVIGPRGNSLAGPHVARVPALMMEANPDLPVWELHRLLKGTCADLGADGPDTTYGAGLTQADRAVHALVR